MKSKIKLCFEATKNLDMVGKIHEVGLVGNSK